MPILKTEILGSKIEINYEKNQYIKLIKLIDSFKKRFDEFPNNGRINNNSIIFLAALKVEDNLEETNQILKNKKKDIEEKKSIIKNNILIIEKLRNEILLLENELEIINKKNLSESNILFSCLTEIDNMQKKIDLISQKIKNSFNNE